MSSPTDDQAIQFCLILQAGLPSEQAIHYFTDSTDAGEIAAMLNQWVKSRAVQKAQKVLMGKSWQEMNLEERIDYALNQHYSALAYLLFSVNYISAGPSEKSKLDTARLSLEAKKAGLAGQGDALSRFFADINTGKVKLAEKRDVVIPPVLN